MALKRKSGASFVDVASLKRKSGGSWVPVSNVYRRQGGAWVKVWPVTAAVVQVLASIVYIVSNGTQYITVGSSVTGGVGPFTYSWSLSEVSPPGSITISGSATSQSVTVQSVGTNRYNNATLTLTVTDLGNGSTVSTGVGYLDIQHGVAA